MNKYAKIFFPAVIFLAQGCAADTDFTATEEQVSQSESAWYNVSLAYYWTACNKDTMKTFIADDAYTVFWMMGLCRNQHNKWGVSESDFLTTVRLWKNPVYSGYVGSWKTHTVEAGLSNKNKTGPSWDHLVGNDAYNMNNGEFYPRGSDSSWNGVCKGPLSFRGASGRFPTECGNYPYNNTSKGGWTYGAMPHANDLPSKLNCSNMQTVTWVTDLEGDTETKTGNTLNQLRGDCNNMWYVDPEAGDGVAGGGEGAE